jgi:hypothetical protein
MRKKSPGFHPEEGDYILLRNVRIFLSQFDSKNPHGCEYHKPYKPQADALQGDLTYTFDDDTDDNVNNIGCSFCRLIRRPEYLIGRRWYLSVN